MAVRARLMSHVDCAMERLLAWDDRAGHWISGNRFLRRFMRLFVTATYLGDGYVWGGLGLGLIVFGDPIDRWNVLIGLGVTIVNVAVFRFLKLLFTRPRPDSVGYGLRSRAIDTYSFPSGHATTSFGLAWVVLVSYPHSWVGACVYLVAATISLSRIVVREHHPLDVLFGALLGTLVSVLLFPFFRWLFL